MIKAIVLTCLLIATHTQGPKNKIKWDKTTHDFGLVTQGDVLVTEFKFYNYSDSPFLIENVVSSCGCTTGKWPKTAVNPGDSGIIEVTFNTEGKRKKHEKVIAIYSSHGLFEIGVFADIKTR
ncbi:MAG: DUF1573 domain-containing protein [Bacteroidetes bacterium]|nr:DUF1573 domain-containing protein [Bacteroidota bacterium]